MGGGGSAAIRLAPAWQFVLEFGGCKLLGQPANISGDSLTYMIGPRWVHYGAGAFSGHLQLLAGGNKLTQERMWPNRKELLQQLTTRNNTPPSSHEDYTDEVSTNAVAFSAGGGIDYKLNSALAFRMAEISYRHSWTAPLWGKVYSNGLTVAMGLVVHFGTW